MSPWRDGLGRVVGGAAIPYGYTVTTWASGGLLVATHGPPTTLTAFLFLVGAVATFSALALVAGSPPAADAPSASPRRTAVTSALSAVAGFGVGALVADLLPGRAAYLLVPVVATGAYFALGAVGAALAVRGHRG